VYLAALEARRAATGRELFLVLDNGPCHTSTTSRAVLAARADWLRVIWLASSSPSCPALNRKEREWRWLKRDVRGHLARTLQVFADEILAGLARLARLGGERCDIVDRVPPWFLDGHRRPPTGRSPGRPVGAKDSYQRVVRRRKVPAHTEARYSCVKANSSVPARSRTSSSQRAVRCATGYRA
jgi:hypothetical protein